MSAVISATRAILNLALIALFAMCLAMIVIGFGLPATGRELLIIDGGSMAPAIPNGSAIVVGKPETDLAVGDVVAIRIPTSGAVFTHRIVAIEAAAANASPMLRTRGDANSVADAGLSPASWVVGRLEVSVPSIGRLVAFLQSTNGRIALVSAFVFLLVVGWLWNDHADEAERTEAALDQDSARAVIHSA